MKTEQSIWTKENGWQPELSGKLCKSAQLVVLFGSTSSFNEENIFDELKSAYPDAHLWGCTTAGEICGIQVSDETMVATIVEFEHTEVLSYCAEIDTMEDSYSAGTQLGKEIKKDGLVHVLVLSDGLKVNGSDLVRGLKEQLGESAEVTGGLSGDGVRFEESFVLHDGTPKQGVVSAIGLYGDRLKVGYGSQGGWDTFGPERLVTKSKGNILYEMDGKSALELYKQYLGEHADGLPASGLLFPLSLRSKNGAPGLVRTILAVDEEEDSMTFAGDVPEGEHVQLMKANFDRLIDGAEGAARICHESLESIVPDLVLMVSCVGRKMILQQRIEEEVEEAAALLGEGATIMGFYSYGEISPFDSDSDCELHNQTMTITVLKED